MVLWLYTKCEAAASNYHHKEWRGGKPQPYSSLYICESSVGMLLLLGFPSFLSLLMQLHYSKYQKGMS